MATEQELDYISKHPGGFDREFFEEHLVSLVEQWKQWADTEEYVVRLTTADGRQLDLAYGRSAQTYLIAFTEVGGRPGPLEIIPTQGIERVTVDRRPAEAPDRPVGFTMT